MIENLASYGPLGMFALAEFFLIKWLMKNQNKREDKLVQVIENNTQVLSLCHARRGRF